MVASASPKGSRRACRSPGRPSHQGVRAGHIVVATARQYDRYPSQPSNAQLYYLHCWDNARRICPFGILNRVPLWVAWHLHGTYELENFL